MTELRRMIASKKVSPGEVVRAHLDRIAALDGKLKAYITVLADAALAAARVAETAVMSGAALGPLHGVPVGLKDLYCTKGVRTTGGSKILADWVPEEDATVVARLVGTGAIVLGKLNMHEFAYGPEGLNPHYGTPWNPWDAKTHRVCGGGSSGSGAAVAGRVCSRGRPPRPKAALRPREPRGRAAARVVHGPRRADVPERGGLRPHAGAHGGLRPPRPDHPAAGGGPLRG